MKYICKKKFGIDGYLIGEEGDIVEITDAVPTHEEPQELVEGYCDIFNLRTGEKWEATWNDVPDDVVPVSET